MKDFLCGFTPHDRKSPVTDAWQPLWSRWGDDAVEIGFDVAVCHCNARGLLHGGMLATLADNAMGLSLGLALKGLTQLTALPAKGAISGIVTTSLNLDYVGMAPVGQRVVISPRVVHIGKGSGVVDALVFGDGITVARANGAFRVLRDGLKSGAQTHDT